MDEHEVYECWITGAKDSFVKLDTAPKVTEWLKAVMREWGVSTHINIAIHSSSEYEF